MALAVRLHAESRLAEAAAGYRQILAASPDHADALNGLAVAMWQQGRLDDALSCVARAVKKAPGVWRYHQTHGLIASAMQRTQEAADAFQRACALKPESSEAWAGLAGALQALQRFDDALPAYRKAQSLGSLSPETINNFGVALERCGQYGEALEVLRRGLVLSPGMSELWFNYGKTLAARGASAEAIAAYTRAVTIDPGNSKTLVNLGNVLRAAGEMTAAIDCYQRAIALDPGDHDAHNNMGVALLSKGDVDEALEALQRAIALRPDSSAAHNNLGNVLKGAGQMEAAIAAFRRAASLAPRDSQPHSNLVYSLYFHPGYDEAAILREAKAWASAHAPPIAPPIARPRRVANADVARTLNIGYVSPDFRDHCQSLFTMPLLANHDHSRFKIHCYAHLRSPDATTQRLSAHADVWRPIYGANDAQVDSTIRADGIDILVDLTMHMSDGRPLLFARKPAPVQVAWLAYPGTTGQPAIDFRLTDPWLDPPEFDNGRYVERSVRLPSTFWCYDPGTGSPPVNVLPAIAAGHVTFGCLNNFCKISDRSLSLWGRVMCEVPRSRLLLLAAPGTHRSRVLEILHGIGIAAGRVEFVPFQKRDAYLETYHRIDVCLDTLPYNGHTTSLDAYWMGVPVVTRVGDTIVGRAGWSQLNNLKLTELAAFDDEDFVRKSAALASDIPTLSSLRCALRARMQQSPLMDGVAFAAAMESAYRYLWQLP
jgi:protein O-GlcNAc transferase